MACFCVTACHIQMKGKAYNKFSLPPNQKATAAKAGALRLRGGSRIHPEDHKGAPAKQINHPLSHFDLQGAFMQMAIGPASLSGFRLQHLASHYSLTAPNTACMAFLLLNALAHLPSAACTLWERPPPTWEAVTAGFGKGKPPGFANSTKVFAFCFASSFS